MKFVILLTVFLISCSDDNGDTNDCNPKEVGKGSTCEDGSWKEYYYDKGCENNDHPGYKKIQHNNKTREYILLKPSSQEDSQQHPLIINFHGFGGCAKSFLKDSFAEDFTKKGFIIAYPQAVTSTKGAPSWNPFPTKKSDDMTSDDHFFVKKLIETISEGHDIHPQKIYASGYSNGGMMAYGLACHQDHNIAAIGVMSGIMIPDTTCNVVRTIPIIHFHSRKDAVLPFSGNDDYQSIDETIKFWLTSYNLVDNPSVILLDSSSKSQLTKNDIQKKTYPNNAISLYVIDRKKNTPSDHVWFTETIGADPANSLLMNFFNDNILE